MPRIARLALVSLALAVIGCSNPLERIPLGPPLPDPEQSPAAAAPFALGPVTVAARARYALDAFALIVDDELDDDWSDVVPVDVAFGWGPMRSPALLSKLSLHLKRRYVSVRMSADFPLDPRTVMRHLANHHLVAATPEIATRIADIRASDRVRLSGYLVDLSAPGRPPMRTSLSRTDVGSGACEVVYVTELSVQPLP